VNKTGHLYRYRAVLRQPHQLPYQITFSHECLGAVRPRVILQAIQGGLFIGLNGVQSPVSCDMHRRYIWVKYFHSTNLCKTFYREIYVAWFQHRVRCSRMGTEKNQIGCWEQMLRWRRRELRIFHYIHCSKRSKCVYVCGGECT
jgi:hypothetical protein